MIFILKLIIFLPLFAACANGIFCKNLSNKIASFISTSSIIISTICAIFVFNHVGINKNIMHIIWSNWISIDSLSLRWSLYVDSLTAIMFVLVTSVSAVVHIYSLTYMKKDKNLPKFLAYLSLFTFFMLALVASDNFLQLFFGWEGVGVCSYLLIGYYYHKESANNAAIKAFIVNRVADFAFIIGILMIAIYANSLDFKIVFKSAESLSKTNLNFLGNNFSILDIICMMLFIGCMGKSAQIGLHVWLPDAMEGPTPVSALIHAATMVTAGVFLLARCSFMFEHSPLILTIITIIGASTCLFAALIAITQTDIKKIIAYSTCSQLGYMFFACGVSAYQAGIFHLVTHGFFKALLFLSAGSVIHTCGKQNIFEMGGLRSKMPLTYASFWIGSLAIIGVYPFAGFYSKDLILESAYKASSLGIFAFYLGIIAAILTAIYSMKIIILVFHGNTNLDQEDYENLYEHKKMMIMPILILVPGALFSGMIGYYILSINSPYGFFAGAIFNKNISNTMDHLPFIIESLPLLVGITGSILGIYIYRNNLYNFLSEKFGLLYILVKRKFFFDEIFKLFFVNSFRKISTYSSLFDINIIDKFGPNLAALTVRSFSWCMSQIQTGYVSNYVFYIIFSIITCITFFLGHYFIQYMGYLNV